ncbi:MAG: nuclear transport factor 2 family protein [Paludibacter sp.]|nr:nuclear transport factor 2 family protein [Paludibacter sp.]
MNSQVVLDFVDAINRADVDKMYELMTDDHLFVDSRDNKTSGREIMKQAWIGYFDLFPDYRIEITGMLQKKSLLCMYGYASGTYKNLKDNNNSNHWRIPAAWTAIIKNNRIKNWQVYADNGVVMDIVNKNN